MTYSEKKAVREAKIEWRKEMATILGHYLSDPIYHFSFHDVENASYCAEEAEKAMLLRGALYGLKTTLLKMNEFSEILLINE